MNRFPIESGCSNCLSSSYNFSSEVSVILMAITYCNKIYVDVMQRKNT
jgi:hypothetical protein